MKRDKINN